ICIRSSSSTSPPAFSILSVRYTVTRFSLGSFSFAIRYRFSASRCWPDLSMRSSKIWRWRVNRTPRSFSESLMPATVMLELPLRPRLYWPIGAKIAYRVFEHLLYFFLEVDRVGLMTGPEVEYLAFAVLIQQTVGAVLQTAFITTLQDLQVRFGSVKR